MVALLEMLYILIFDFDGVLFCFFPHSGVIAIWWSRK